MSLSTCHLEYGSNVARLHRRSRAYALTSNTPSHANHEKINSWVSFFPIYGMLMGLRLVALRATGAPLQCAASCWIVGMRQVKRWRRVSRIEKSNIETLKTVPSTKSFNNTPCWFSDQIFTRGLVSSFLDSWSRAPISLCLWSRSLWLICSLFLDNNFSNI